jgi:CBS domain-containing protein
MDLASIQRIDAYPYRHRVGDVMQAPVVTAAPTMSLAEAATMMAKAEIGALVVVDGGSRAVGIVTERDLLMAVARLGAAALDQRLQAVMSAPVEGLPADALLYRAIARLLRRGFRHLPVLDGNGRPIGMVSARTLLRERATSALLVGSDIELAEDTATLRAAHDRLPGLAAALLAEEVPATQVAAVISAVTRDLTARAAEIGLLDMASRGQGTPPAPWCLLVLGSAGRGESLLAPDQDNALVYDGNAAACDPWFEAFARELNTRLDSAGIPLCKGNVMARNPAYRRSLDGWRQEMTRWASHEDPQALLAIDIFLDFVGVAGELSLATRLREEATAIVGHSTLLVRLLADAARSTGSPFDLLGRLRSRDGRIDLKRHGTFPLVAGARAIALAMRSRETATRERLLAAAATEAISGDDAERLEDARAVVVDLLLRGQLADLAEGTQASSSIAQRRLSRNERDRLKEALRQIAGMHMIVDDALERRRVGS